MADTLNILAKYQLSLTSNRNIGTLGATHRNLFTTRWESLCCWMTFVGVQFGEDYHHQRCTYCPTETAPIACPPDCFCKHPPDDGRDHI